MRRFGVKRHVVRSGLADLERMGIVERVPNRGAMVRAYTADGIQKLYVLRNLLEGHAARSIPMPLARKALKRTSGGFSSFMTQPSLDLGRVFHANVNFHELLFSKTDNWYLADAIRQFALRTHGIQFSCLTYPGYLEQARREHWEMIEAIETAIAIRSCDCATSICAHRGSAMRGSLAYSSKSEEAASGDSKRLRRIAPWLLDGEAHGCRRRRWPRVGSACLAPGK